MTGDPINLSRKRESRVHCRVFVPARKIFSTQPAIPPLVFACKYAAPGTLHRRKICAGISNLVFVFRMSVVKARIAAIEADGAALVVLLKQQFVKLTSKLMGGLCNTTKRRLAV
jgi:hypothetical protein